MWSYLWDQCKLRDLYCSRGGPISEVVYIEVALYVFSERKMYTYRPTINIGRAAYRPPRNKITPELSPLIRQTKVISADIALEWITNSIFMTTQFRPRRPRPWVILIPILPCVVCRRTQQTYCMRQAGVWDPHLDKNFIIQFNYLGIISRALLQQGCIGINYTACRNGAWAIALSD